MENDYYGLVYKFTNIINSKIYIGQTKNLNDRIKQHKKSAKYNKGNMAISKAIAKYGFENFNVDILDYAYSVDELNQLEEHYINSLNSLTPQGYNIQEYCNGNQVWSDERKLEVTKKNLNRKRPNAISKYFGVTYNKRDNNWVASVIFQKKDFRVGKYDTEIEAAQARDIEILKDKYFGLFELNFPELREDYLNNKIVVLRSMDKKLKRNAIKITCLKTNKTKKVRDKAPDIYHNKETNSWVVVITHNTNLYHVGTFNSEFEAVEAHKNKLLELNI